MRTHSESFNVSTQGADVCRSVSCSVAVIQVCSVVYQGHYEFQEAVFQNGKSQRSFWRSGGVEWNDGGWVMGDRDGGDG